MPVAQTSAAANSSALIPGRAGTRDDVPTPGSRSGRSAAAAPAAHSASRRLMPKQSSAPAVANASVCGTVSGTRPVRSTSDPNGPHRSRSATRRCANSSPMWRTAPRPNRTSFPPFSSVAWARLAFTHAPCTRTPCRRASATSDCGE